MKCTIAFIVSLVFCTTSFAQLDSTDFAVRRVVKRTETMLSNLLGEELVRKYFRVDYTCSKTSGQMTYPGTYQNRMPGIESTVFDLNFNIIQGKDTTGYISLRVDSVGALVPDYMGNESGIPETLYGFKRLLTNSFLINYKKAVAIARAKGFQDTPYLAVEPDYKAITHNNSTYIKVKYLWAIWDLNEKGHAILRINAETGKIESEEYMAASSK